MKEYSTLSKALELESHHQMQFSVTPRIPNGFKQFNRMNTPIYEIVKYKLKFDNDNSPKWKLSSIVNSVGQLLYYEMDIQITVIFKIKITSLKEYQIVVKINNYCPHGYYNFFWTHFLWFMLLCTFSTLNCGLWKLGKITASKTDKT